VIAALGSEEKTKLILAGNRVGKTSTGLREIGKMLRDADPELFAALCKEMEAHGRQQDLEPAAGLLVQVQREYAAVCRALDGLGAESRAA